MSDFAKMDIFFVVTTAVVVVIGILLVLILIRVFRILGHVERISEMVSEEGALMRGDIAAVRGRIREEGFKLQTMWGLFRKTATRFFTRPHRK